MKKIILAFIILTLSHSVLAGSESHGGTGVRIDGKTYLLDFVESGIENSPYIAKESEVDPLILESFDARLKVVFKSMDDFPTRLLATKLAEIYQLNGVTAVSLLKGMEMLNWRSVNIDLLKTSDGTNIILNADEVQLAVREGQTIRFAAKKVAVLSDVQKVGLAIHEIVYAMISLEQQGKGKVQNVGRVREITAYLFGEELKSKGPQGLIEILGGSQTWSLNAEIPRNIGTLSGPYIPLARVYDINQRDSKSNNFFWEYHYYLEQKLAKNILIGKRDFIREVDGQVQYNPGATVTFIGKYPENTWSLTVYKNDTEKEVAEKVDLICENFSNRNKAFMINVSFTFESINIQHSTFSKENKKSSLLFSQTVFNLEDNKRFPINEKSECNTDWVKSFVNSQIRWNAEDFK